LGTRAKTEDSPKLHVGNNNNRIKEYFFTLFIIFISL